MSKGESRIGANSASQIEVHIKPPNAAQCTLMVNAPLMSCNTGCSLALLVQSHYILHGNIIHFSD